MLYSRYPIIFFTLGFGEFAALLWLLVAKPIFGSVSGGAWPIDVAGKIWLAISFCLYCYTILVKKYEIEQICIGRWARIDQKQQLWLLENRSGNLKEALLSSKKSDQVLASKAGVIASTVAQIVLFPISLLYSLMLFCVVLKVLLSGEGRK